MASESTHVYLVEAVPAGEVVHDARLVEVGQLGHVVHSCRRRLRVLGVYAAKARHDLDGSWGYSLITNKGGAGGAQRRRRTVLPLVVAMVASPPLISVTTPSTHASPGSSSHTCEPTMMFTGVPCMINCHQATSCMLAEELKAAGADQLTRSLASCMCSQQAGRTRSKNRLRTDHGLVTDRSTIRAGGLGLISCSSSSRS